MTDKLIPDPATLVDPGIWATTGGLAGLVIMALFGALYIILIAQKKIYETHREELKLMMETHQKEREVWMQNADLRQKETNVVIQGVTVALDKMNERTRKFDTFDGCKAVTLTDIPAVRR